MVLSNLGRDSALESGSAWHRRSDTGLDYWLRADATGIYRVAAKSDVDAEPKPDRIDFMAHITRPPARWWQPAAVRPPRS